MSKIKLENLIYTVEKTYYGESMYSIWVEEPMSYQQIGLYVPAKNKLMTIEGYESKFSQNRELIFYKLNNYKNGRKRRGNV